MSYTVEPMFKLGKIPGLPNCEIQKIDAEGGNHKYFIRNNYNPWASGWADEDFIINQIAKEKQRNK